MRDEEFIEDFLREVRQYQPKLPPASLLELVAYEELIFPNTRERGDQHATFRLSILYALHKEFSLRDHAFIRFLFEQEIIYHQRMWGFDPSIYLGGFLLFVLADVEDIQLLWQAKTTSFDTYGGFDVQLLVGAGVSTTLEYLQQIHEPWSYKARELIEQCHKRRIFDDLEGYRQKWDIEFRRRASLKRFSIL